MLYDAWRWFFGIPSSLLCEVKLIVLTVVLQKRMCPQQLILYSATTAREA